MANTTIARIDSGAMIGIGSAGTLDVGADQQVVAVSLVQSGGAGGNIGFAGTLSWYNLTSHTTAQIEDGVTVNAGTSGGQPQASGAVTVHADDDMIVVGVTGGAVKSNHIGIGFAAAVNNINRTTLALIGSTSTPTMPGSFTAGVLHVNATNQGIVAGVSYAGSSVSSSEGTPATSNADEPTDDASLPSEFGSDDPLDETNGIAASGDASFNILKSDTEAYVNDKGTFNIGAAAPTPLPVDPSSSLQPLTVIHFLTSHGLVTGQPVNYTTTGGSIGGLSNNTTYYAIVIDPNNIELATTEVNALDGVPITLGPTVTSGFTYNLTSTFNSLPTILTFTSSSVENTLINFVNPHGLITGQPVEYQTTGNATGGLSNQAIYYAIVTGSNQIELAATYADAISGTAIALDYSKGSGTQTLTPITTDIEAASETIIVSIAGAFAVATNPDSSNLGIAGSVSSDDVIDTTKAYLQDATLTTYQLDVTATHSGYIGSLTAGASGASGVQGTAVAGSVSVDVILPDTEAYIENAEVALSGDSNVKAIDQTQIWSIAGSGALGGKGGYGAAIAVNLIGFSFLNTVDPAKTLAYIDGSTVTLDSGTLSVLATDANATPLPRIVSIAGALGVGTQAESNAVAAMVAVNIIKDETEAYVEDSTITKPASPTGTTNLDVASSDDSWIISIGGAVGASDNVGVGAGISYNQIAAQTESYIDDTTVTVGGTVNVQATDSAEIAGGTLGVGVSTGSGGIAGAGSASVNEINDTTKAYIDGGSTVTAGGAVSVVVTDSSLIVSVAGGVAISLDEGSAVGAAVSYNIIGNIIPAYIDDAIVTSESAGVDGDGDLLADARGDRGSGAPVRRASPWAARSRSTRSRTRSTPTSTTARTSRPMAATWSWPPRTSRPCTSSPAVWASP